MQSASCPSELEIQLTIQRHRARLHEQVDERMDRMLLDFGLQPPEGEPTIGMSFEPAARFESVPEDTLDVMPGIYEVRPGRQVEVVPSHTQGKVFFELVDSQGQLSTRSLDETLFHQLFRTNRLLEPVQGAKVRYGLHPLNSKIAVRYNTDGTVTLGSYGEQGEFIADV